MRILIVAWAWPPIGRVGALRPLGMAREWTRAGQEVHVLTGPGDRGGEFSPDLEARALESGATVHRAAAPGMPAPPSLRPAHEKGLEALVARPTPRWRQIAAQWKTFPDPQRGWIRPARRLALRLHAQAPFDLVFSSSPPESTHYVARALAEVGVPWVADFRDQWSDYLLGRWDRLSRRIIDAITRGLLRRATLITAATEGVCRSIQRASGRSVLCVRNGHDGVIPSGLAVRPRLLGYFGRVDPLMQHPERLWPAFRRLREDGRPWAADFYLSPGGGGGASLSPPPDLADLVRVLPPLPHADALRTMQTMGALLVLGWETRGGETAVAAKLYEYVGSGRPVLVLAPQGFEARTLIEANGCGLGAWGDDEIRDSLSRLEGFTPAAGRADSLSRRRSAEQLLEAMKAALAERRPIGHAPGATSR